MKRLNTFYFFFLIFYFSFALSDQKNNSDYRLEPETVLSKQSQELKEGEAKDAIIVSANKYSTDAAWNILKSGGNAADATVTLQLVLGLVEPQSSGIGGGSFLTYLDKTNNSVISYDGRETAPFYATENLFLDEKKKSIPFFDAIVGGLSVGVPGTLDLLFEFHKDYGDLSWEEVIKPAIKLAENGFYPPQRLRNAILKEKFLLSENINNEFFSKIKNEPFSKIKNLEYASTLKKISENYKIFYNGEIAIDIVNKVKNHPRRPGLMELTDLSNYRSIKSKALCYKLEINTICGPNLPSSGNIAIIQALILYENYNFKSDYDEFTKQIEILEFIYSLRKEYLGDSRFVDVNLKKLLNKSFLLAEFEKFLIFPKKQNVNIIKNEFNSTSHFSIVDFYGNVVSMTSSIESSFGSRQFTNGFLLNNQLSDFNFQPLKNKKKVKNRVQGGKKPLSSMSPLIILDEKNNFLFSVGSPGGTAIISYVFKSIIDVLYMKISPIDSIKKGNFVSKDGKVFIEKNMFDLEKIKSNYENVIERNLISGIAIIKKEKNLYRAAADIRRDGSVVGE